ncbi:MAG: hypothetical protein AAF982_08740 [Pseudomonadota bacterium]
MAYYKATVEILVDVKDEGEACDCIAETLRPHLKEFESTSSMIDWRYSDQNSFPAPDDGANFEYANSN